MNTDFPYSSSNKTHSQPSNYEVKLQIQNDDEDKNSLLLTTEPKDLDRLFSRSLYQQTVEQDICFPSYRNSDEHLYYQHYKLKRKSNAYHYKVDSSASTPTRCTIENNLCIINRKPSSEAIVNLEALQLFSEINEKPLYGVYPVQLSALESQVKDNLYIQSEESILADQLKTKHSLGDEKQLLSLYGDNKPSAFVTTNSSCIETQKDRFTYYHPDIGSIKGTSLTELQKPPTYSLEDLLVKENYWIDIASPTLEEMKILSKVFHIHPLTTEDIISHEIREKCDVFRHYVFVCYRAFVHDHQGLLKPVTFYNIVTKTYILTFHFGHVPHVDHVQQRVKQLQDYIEVVPDWINYAIMDEITDSFAPMIQQIESEVDVVDELVLHSKTDQSDLILRIGACRKRVIQLMRLLSTKVEVVKGLIKRMTEERYIEMSYELPIEEKKIYPDVGLYLGDVQDHILTMIQNLNHYEVVLARSESNYLARISIELTQTSNSTNQVIGRLTTFATVLLPMNLITGLWGMNVKVPGGDYDDLMFFFWIVLSLASFAILALTIAKKFKLI